MQAESIIGIKKIGLKKSCDIEVNNKSHIFFGNGIATHNSHSLCYGITGYHCAYAKTHFPVHSYTSWLRYAQDKGKPFEEYAELVDDAKIMGVEVYPPNIIDLKLYFYTDGEIINYGISNIKGIAEKTGLAVINAVKQAEIDFKPIKDWSWYEFLILVGYDAKKTSIEALIKVGAFRKMNLTRSQMLEEYDAICTVNANEFAILRKRYKDWTNIPDAIEGIAKTKKNGGGCHTEKRVEKLISRVDLLRNPIVSYRDHPSDIANNEAELLGTSITCSIADGKPGERWNGYCKDCLSNNKPSNIILKVKIEEFKEYIPKKCKREEDIGKPMAFLRISDSTCSLNDITCFTSDWEKYKNILTPGRVVEVHLEKSFRGDRFHIKSVWTI